MAEPRLFPQTEPFKRFHLTVDGGHELYIELCGRADGEPVVVLHGGPGAGTSPFLRRFFDPSRYLTVLFDQRGAGRSRPRGSLEANTTWDLVADIERIREHLKVDRWQVFGGSWGSTLALLYAQAYPERVSRMILRGVFTMTKAELNWFYGGPAGNFFPEAWSEFTAPIPESERDDLIRAYHRRLTSGDEAEQIRFARPWVRWESACAALRPGASGMVDGPYARAFARIESHFFVNHGWLDRDDQILADVDRIAHIPSVIVQGRYDMICPPMTALRLAEAWPMAEVNVIDDAGHALSERGVTDALLKAMAVSVGSVAEV
ncbi:MAG: prolyl aminopeptidase [Pseudomonadota bacterium]